MHQRSFLPGDRDFMLRALRLAERGRGSAHPNPLVGAVLVKGGRVIGEGWHAHAGGEHAEIAAMRSAGEEVEGSTLYVTLEPCNHQGRTPPCTEALLHRGVRRVVYARRDINPSVKGGGAAFLREQGVEVSGGLLEDRAREMNRDWEKYVTTGIPYVTLKVAMTADGRIAAGNGSSRWITGPKARRKVHLMRRSADAVLTGIGTVLADDPELTVREVPLGRARPPLRVVADSRLRIPLEAKLANGGPPTIIFTTPAHDRRKADALRERGVEVIEVGSRESRVCLEEALRVLGERGVVDLLVEAGAGLNAALMEAGLADRVAIFVAPRVFGGREALPWLGGKGAESPGNARTFRWTKAVRVGEDFLLEGLL